jgi:hypothetical protein
VCIRWNEIFWPDKTYYSRSFWLVQDGQIILLVHAKRILRPNLMSIRLGFEKVGIKV